MGIAPSVAILIAGNNRLLSQLMQPSLVMTLKLVKKVHFGQQRGEGRVDTIVYISRKLFIYFPIFSNAKLMYYI
jgi:hypothetical protein